MSSLISSQNFSALQHNISVADQINSTCEPLFRAFNLTHFGYIKVFKDGRYLFLSNDVKWNEIYFSNDLVNKGCVFQEALLNIPEKGTYNYLWPQNNRDEILDALYHANIWHGLDIFEKYEDYIQICFFATSNENHLISDLYLNNIKLLNKFIFYFKEKNKDLIYFSETTKLPYAKCYEEYFQKENNALSFEARVKEFNCHTPIDGCYIDLKAKRVRLSKREIQCIALRCKGNSIKTIGKELGVSHRVVEDYIDNAKHKLECSDRGDLLKIFKENITSEIFEQF